MGSQENSPHGLLRMSISQAIVDRYLFTFSKICYWRWFRSF